MEFILIGLFVATMVLCLIALIKNQINYSIRIKWIHELYDHPEWYYYQQEFTRLSYDKTFWDLTLWKHIPFKDYVKKNVIK